MCKCEVLPSDYNMAIAEVNQRFYPIRIHITEEGEVEFSHIAQFSWSFEDQWFIPSALGPRHTTGFVSFPTYVEAVTFCHRREEHWELLFDCAQLAATSELYPERNAWYADEIQSLAGRAPCLSSVLTEAHAFVFHANGMCHSVFAPTMDEAIKELYEEVSQTYTSFQRDVPLMSNTELEHA